MHKNLFIAIGILLTTLSCQASPNNYKLVLLPQDRGAACLDGSPSGFYINEGTGANKTKYMIFFNSGGFCSGMSQ
jgi:hypothetical protein